MFAESPDEEVPQLVEHFLNVLQYSLCLHDHITFPFALWELELGERGFPRNGILMADDHSVLVLANASCIASLDLLYL